MKFADLIWTEEFRCALKINHSLSSLLNWSPKVEGNVFANKKWKSFKIDLLDSHCIYSIQKWLI